MVLETIILVALGGVVLWLALKWIGAKPRPRLLGSVKTCRGGWAEGRLRGCRHGLAVTGIPVEPLNSFSSLAYLAAGWVTFRLIHDAPSVVLAIAMAVLCVGTALYHGTKAMWAARLDHGGMYAVFAALAFYGIAPDHSAIVFFMSLGAVVMGIGFGFVLAGDVSARMGLLLVLLAARAFLRGTPKLAGLSLLLFGIAFAAWVLDKKTELLARFGHAIWHSLTAAAMTAMFIGLTD